MARPLALLGAFALSSVALAKPWNGLEPGISHRPEVTQKFGEPSKVLKAQGKEVLVYLGKQAIKGTTQAQFKVDPANSLLERIDVFPGPTIDRETIESTYGSGCSAIETAKEAPCYIKRLTDDFRTYFVYAKLGLAVFFNEDGKTVQSFVFQPIKDQPPKETK
jgi:hypothetical protein